MSKKNKNPFDKSIPKPTISKPINKLDIDKIMETNTNLENNQSAETHSDGTAGVSTGDENASIGIEVSAKIGTEASVDGGLDGNNVYVEASYSDTTEVHVTVEGQANAEGFGVNGTVDAYAKTGNEASLEVRAGDEGVVANGELSAGSSVGVDGEGTLDLREGSVTAGAGVSVGEQVGIGGGGEATFVDGVATVGVSGEVAVLLGVDVDLSVSVDTNQIAEDARLAAEQSERAAAEAQELAESTRKETERLARIAQEETERKAREAQEEFNRQARAAQDELDRQARAAQDELDRQARDAQDELNRIANETKKSKWNPKIGFSFKNKKKGVKPLFSF